MKILFDKKWLNNESDKLIKSSFIFESSPDCLGTNGGWAGVMR